MPTIFKGKRKQLLAQKAYLAGLSDARAGRVYRHSADPGSRNRDWLSDYEAGWKEGRP